METNLKTLSTALYSEALIKVSETHARIIAERQKGSGEWLKSERLYNEWLKGDVPTLFILGGPGSGKSFLAGAAIEHIFERNTFQKGSLRVSTGFFYIHEDDTQLRKSAKCDSFISVGYEQLLHLSPLDRTLHDRKFLLGNSF